MINRERLFVYSWDGGRIFTITALVLQKGEFLSKKSHFL